MTKLLKLSLRILSFLVILYTLSIINRYIEEYIDLKHIFFYKFNLFNFTGGFKSFFKENPSVIPLIVAIISNTIVFIIFLYDRILNSNLRKQDSNRDWYDKVVLEPYLAELKTFFEELKGDYEKEVEGLSSLSGHDLILAKAKITSQFSTKIRKIQDDVVIVVATIDPFIGNRLRNILMELEDTITISIDQSTSVNLVQRRIGNSKGDFISALSLIYFGKK